MKTSRKGFTLVELLIVVAILATLTASMTISMQGASAKAKASTIASNVNAMRAAAVLYATNHSGEDLTNVTTDTVLSLSLPTWYDIKYAGATGATDTRAIKYTAATNASDKGPNYWSVKVDFSGDADKDEIKTALQAIKGYGKYDKDGVATDVMPGAVEDDSSTTDVNETAEAKYEFEVMLLSGKIQQVAGTY